MLAASLASALAAIASRPRGNEIQPRAVEWLTEIQTPPRGKLEPIALDPLLVDDAGAPIRDRAGWERRRERLRQTWLAFLGELRLPRQPIHLTTLEEDEPPRCIRRLVRYEIEPGLTAEAYLLLPKGAQGRRPAVVVLHSTVQYTIRQSAGLEGPPDVHFGLRLAQRGYVAICPRCFLWQGTAPYRDQVSAFQKRHPGAKGMAKMLWDAVRGADILTALPQVDPERIGALGHSLGAKETLYLAAFDPRIKVAVASEGGIGTRFSNWDAVWYLGETIRQPSFALEHHQLLAMIAPRAFLLIGGDSADGDQSWPFIEASLPVWKLYDPPARVGLFNHKKGHSVPPEAQERIYQWFDAYL
jgi:hypothetical protein